MIMDYKILNFVIFCVGSVADALKMSAKDVYHRMSKGGIISDYIVPCYDVLHTFSREYIVEDLVDLMNKKGVLKLFLIFAFNYPKSSLQRYEIFLTTQNV